MTAAPERTGRTGRPPLTDEQKGEIRLEIAVAALDLFAAQGVAATTGEQIGRAVGISARTVWRYFPSKEACVRPLLSAGIDAIAAELRAGPLAENLDRFVTDGLRLAPGRGIALIRLTRTEPGLRAVWLQSCDEAESAFARALAARAGLSPDDLRPTVQAAVLNAVLRAAVEHFAWHTYDPSADPDLAERQWAQTVRQALATASEGIA
ncbi:helix-turn-helix domain-containing protein [Streptomyces sp. NPDC004539]|uniref:TetR/AcrR family transcriptional regulator n=1 Tax=Streptomyces sp. NPDC004539 TaxID=3154280 RepID=UPI0033A33038